MLNAKPTRRSRRTFLGLGAAGLLALPVAAAGLVGYPTKRSRGCSGPPVGGGTTSSPPPGTQQQTPSFRPSKTEGFGRGGGDHHEF
jgi:hypothetical protein